MYPTRGQVKQLYFQLVDDPGARTFTDTPNPVTGALSIFQSGFSQAFDILFNNALLQQVPAVEQVTQGIIVPPSPVPFSLTPADMGLPSFADYEWIAERAAGSSEKFRDIFDNQDRLSQRAPVDRLLETVWENQAFQFVGCTSAREIQIKWVSSNMAPIDDNATIPFDNSRNFLANYAAGVTAGNKGYNDIAQTCLQFAVGPRFNQGIIGGELYRLLAPLVRNRQLRQMAIKPYTTDRRRRYGYRAVPFVAAQQGTTGGGSQNVPVQFSSARGEIIGDINGTNPTFWLYRAVLSFTLMKNGVFQTVGVDYTPNANQFDFLPDSIPQPDDILTAEAILQY